MAVRSHVDAGRVANVAMFMAIVLLLGSLATVNIGFAIFTAGALIGCAIGGVVFLARSRRGLGASLTSEHPPEYAGTINIAHIPVIGTGGLGILAMSIFVAFFLPDGQRMMTWSISGAIVGASAFLMWRHFHSGSPFAEHPEETLHLR